MSHYLSANQYYQNKFGSKVYKLSIDAGFTCPNRDGTVGDCGCIFCDGSGAFAAKAESISEQLQKAKLLVEKKNRNGKYIAYFQAFTNTYAPVEYLRKVYYEAIEDDNIVGLAIGTRPDCLPSDVLELLIEINEKKPVCIELGLQTSNDETAMIIERGYDFSVYQKAVQTLKQAGIETITHIILGLPGETVQDAVQTTKDAIASGTNGVKFHLLHVLKDTVLANWYQEGRFSCLSLEEYGQWLIACLNEVPQDIVVHRITGDGAKRNLIAPLWSGNKKQVLNYLNNLLQVTYGGSHETG